MSIQIDRFNPIKMAKHFQIKFEKKGWVAIEDREKGEYCCVVKLTDDYDKNIELGYKIIELIEEEINEQH